MPGASVTIGGVSEPLNPLTQSTPSDPALKYAQRQLRLFRRAEVRARFFHQAGEMTILITTAATVVVAALHAAAIVTATIAAVTLFLTGFRQVIGPDENWVRVSRAWVAVDRAVARYELVPESERDLARQRALLEQVIAISDQETDEWEAQQRKRTAVGIPQDGSGRSGSAGSA